MARKPARRVSATPWLLLVGWTALILTAAVNAPRLQSVMTKGTQSVPGSESDQVQALRRSEFSDGAAKTMALVFSSPTLNVSDSAYREAAEGG